MNKGGNDMKKVKEDALKKRQPNSETREEFLIVLEYLLTEAYDEEHATSQSKIVKYAEEKYGAYVRRDRINQILVHLVQLQEKYPEKMPFKIHAKKVNKIYRFYVDERMFSDREILDIVSSIINDRTRSDNKNTALVEKVLSVSANEHKKAELSKNIRRLNRKGRRNKNSVTDLIETYNQAILNKYRLWFKFKSFHDVNFNRRSLAQRDRNNSDEGLTGFAYQIIDRGENTLVVLYIDSEKNAAVAKIENIQLLRDPMDIGDWADDINFELDDRRYHTIDEWLDSYFKGTDGYTREITIRVPMISERFFESFKADFERYWQIPVIYEVRQREAIQLDYDENGNSVETTVIVDDAYVTFTSNLSSFRHWYMQFKVFSSVLIIEPAYLNDRLLAPIAERLMKRVTKYGESFNYEFTRTLKPEYEAALNERRELRRRYLEERKNKGEDK